MNFLLWLLGQGALVSLVVDALKRIPFVEKHPKLAAATLNALALAVSDVLGNHLNPNLVNFVWNLAAAFAASIGFYQLKKDAVSAVK